MAITSMVYCDPIENMTMVAFVYRLKISVHCSITKVLFNALLINKAYLTPSEQRVLNACTCVDFFLAT